MRPNTINRLALGLMLGSAAFSVTLSGIIIYTVVHFISKWW